MTETESGIGKLLDLARGDRKYLANLDQLRRKIVVMFTDIQGSTAYFEKHGDAAGLLMVHQCNDALRTIVDGHDGRVIKTIGDGMLATFEDCGRSIEAGIKMQHGLREISRIAGGDRPGRRFASVSITTPESYAARMSSATSSTSLRELRA